MMAAVQRHWSGSPSRLATAAGVAAVCLLAPTSSSALTLGPSAPPATFDFTVSTGAYSFWNHSAPSGVQLTAPSAGVLTRFRTAANKPVTLRVFRRSGSTTNYSGVATGPTVAPGGAAGTVVTTETHMPILAGDTIGFDGPNLTTAGGTASGWTAAYRNPPLPDGGSPMTPLTSGSMIFVNADFEPDADGDSFGDVSQDRCVGSGGSDRGCAPGVLDAQSAPQVVEVVRSEVSGVAQLGTVSINKARSKLSLVVNCPAGRPQSCQGTTSAATAGKIRLHAAASKKKVLKLGSTRFKIASGQSKTLTIRISSKNRRRIKSLKTLRLKLTLNETSTSTKTL
jgi:hypothetical protein